MVGLQQAPTGSRIWPGWWAGRYYLNDLGKAGSWAMVMLMKLEPVVFDWGTDWCTGLAVDN